jgi:hypothetical protein
MATKNIIGFSTGDLYRSKMSTLEMAELFYSVGANAIELSFATPAKLFKAEKSGRLIKLVKKFDYITLHASWKELTYGPDETTKKVLAELRLFCNELPIRSIVMHPDIVKDFKILADSGLPFAIENMDNRKKFGINAADFKTIKKLGDFNYVIDLQHVYDHDHGMKLASELIKVMGKKISHYHVSGYTKDEIHVPVHLASNREEIANCLKKMPRAPIILEGLIASDAKKVAKKELEFIANCIKS